MLAILKQRLLASRKHNYVDIGANMKPTQKSACMI